MKVIEKLKNVSVKYKEPTRVCKICFKDIKIHSLYSFYRQNLIICDECRLSMTPKFIPFNVHKYKGISIYEYTQTIKKLIYQFKGCFDIELVNVFLEPFITYYRLYFHDYIIIPAPSFKLDNDVRGFNHVIEIFKSLKLPLIEAFEKTEKYKQSDHTFKERKQVSKYLKLSCLENLKSKRILLVDDIFTTGSTMETMVNLIESVNPKDIKIMVIAKTVLK